MPTDYATLKSDKVRWQRHLARNREWNRRNKARKAEYMREYNKEYNRIGK